MMPGENRMSAHSAMVVEMVNRRSYTGLCGKLLHKMPQFGEDQLFHGEANCVF